jgi:signal transduction histidine kinase/ActR/RegA family two-component response regulator
MISIGFLKELFRYWFGSASFAYEFAPVALATFSERKQSLTRCNPLFSELLGYGNCDDCIDNFAVTRHLEENEPGPSALFELGETNKLLGKVLEIRTLTGKTQRVKCNIHRDSKRQCLEIAVFPVEEEPKQPSPELTELKLSRQENSQLQAQLFQARKMHTMGQLTGGFAHDFNNLLAAVIGYTGLVLDKGRDTLDTRIKRYLAEVYKAGQQGQKLVSQMLGFGRSGSTEMVPAMISLLVKDSVQLLRPSLPSSISLEVHIDEHVPSVVTNAFKLNQILMNLCINAKDAMDGVGTLEVHLGSTYLEDAVCSCCGEHMTGQFVQIQVSDTGIGISDEVLSHIFDPFFTTKEIGRGTGVGLSMVDNLMHEHGGHLRVKSIPHQGTTFELLFPPTRKVSSEASTIHLGKSRYQAVHRGHILIVDDDRSVGTYVAEVLKHHGHKVTIEFDSVEALALYQDNPYVFDVVVTDQTMPKLTGSSLMLAMKQLREDIPVIICTAYSENLNEDTAREAGAKGYLGKPIDVDKLIELVDQSLAQNSSSAA